MFRLISYTTACGLMVLLTGCSDAARGPANAAASGMVQAERSAAGQPGGTAAGQTNGEPRSGLVRVLLQWLDDHPLEGSAEERRVMRQILHDADAELHRSLGENAKKMIEQANQRPVGFEVKPPAPSSPADQAAPESPLNGTTAVPDEGGQAQPVAPATP